jgi:hypothetical protein
MLSSFPNRATTQPDLSMPYPIFCTNFCERAKRSERGNLTPTDTSGPSPPRKAKIFLPNLATWSPGQGSSAQAPGCFSA